MRLQQLRLLAYGKFTDRVLALPAAPRDFHFVVGPNEAGKSTTRSAILDLLYGIETRSALDFLHPKPEMKLGAVIEHQGRVLEFVRAKARSRTLFDAAGAPLGETALAGFLGGTDRAFFDQMFGLDHGRLEAGGKAILSTATDVGQILFQSAAGIAGLGRVRDQLKAEAETLWAPRAASHRAYYAGAEALARARDALKAATVRTKDWLDARHRLQAVEAQQAASLQCLQALDAERLRLERVRRVGAALREVQAREAELQALGEVPLLPPDAARQLAEAEIALAGAGRDQQLHAAQARQAAAALAGQQPDAPLLARTADIQALAERRQQLRHHERDIDRRQLELAVLWQQVAALLRQLGWPVSAAGHDEALDQRLPLLPARAALAGLARRFGLLAQARASAQAAVHDQAADLAALAQQLAGQAQARVAPGLRAALATARALGDAAAALARDTAQLQRCERERDAALAALGLPAADPAWLRALRLPAEAEVAQRLKRLDAASALCAALADKARDAGAAVALQSLEITQYREAHQPVTADALAQARAERDACWQAMRTGARPLAAAAADFEARLQAADRLADRRHDTAREAAELQSRLAALQRLQQQAADLAARQAAAEADLAAQAADWSAVWSALCCAVSADAGAGPGVAPTDLPLHAVAAWRATRERALHADDAVADARQALAATRQAGQAAAQGLCAALAASGVDPDPAAPLATLVQLAADTADAAAATQARRAALAQQHEAAVTALAKLRHKAEAAQAEFEAWQRDWQAAASAVGLPATLDVAAAEAALAVMAEIDDKLRGIRELRRARIETMQRDLDDFAAEAGRLAAALAPDAAAQGAAAVADLLAARLARALDQRKEAARLDALRADHAAEAARAGERVARARAGLLPLLRLAGVAVHDGGLADGPTDAPIDLTTDAPADAPTDGPADAAMAGHAALRAAIGRSDQRRAIEAALAAAQRAVAEGGDGLSRDALLAEVAATDAAQVPLRVAEITRQTEVERQLQQQLTREATEAAAQLAAMAGGSDAARAEAERQDALAAMANAAERYVKVHTASRLLKWAIDRYRDTRQGPMLQRAGEIFAALTLGSFQRLVADAEGDAEQPALYGLRADGRRVAVAGMSDGTRDQLYLALRLAALALHLGQGHALPFVADDLFINYDDARARAGLQALADLSRHTQVIFLSHHDHLLPAVRAVFGDEVNVIAL